MKYEKRPCGLLKELTIQPMAKRMTVLCTIIYQSQPSSYTWAIDKIVCYYMLLPKNIARGQPNLAKISRCKFIVPGKGLIVDASDSPLTSASSTQLKERFICWEPQECQLIYRVNARLFLGGLFSTSILIKGLSSLIALTQF